MQAELNAAASSASQVGGDVDRLVLSCVRRGDAYLPPTSVKVRGWRRRCPSPRAVLSLRRAIIVSLIVTPIICLLVAIILFSRLHGRGPLAVRRANVAAVFAVFVAAAAIVMVVQPKSYEVLGASVRSIVAVATNHSVVIGGAPTSPTQASSSAGPPTTSGPSSDGTNLGVKGSYDTIRQNEARILLGAKNVREVLVGRGIGAAVDRGSYSRAGLGGAPLAIGPALPPAVLLDRMLGCRTGALRGRHRATGLLDAAQRAGELSGSPCSYCRRRSTGDRQCVKPLHASARPCMAALPALHDRECHTRQ